MSDWVAVTTAALVGGGAALAVNPGVRYRWWWEWVPWLMLGLILYMLAGAASGILGLWVAELIDWNASQNAVVHGLAAGAAGHALARIEWTGLGTRAAEKPGSVIRWVIDFFHEAVVDDTTRSIKKDVYAYGTSELATVAHRLAQDVEGDVSLLPETRWKIIKEFETALEDFAAELTAGDAQATSRFKLERVVTEQVVARRVSRSRLHAMRQS